MLFEILSRCGNEEYSAMRLGNCSKNEYLRDISKNIASKLNNYRQSGVWDPFEQRVILPYQNISNNACFMNGIIRYVQIVILNYEGRVSQCHLVRSNFLSEQGVVSLKFDLGLEGSENTYPLIIWLNCRFWFNVGFKQ